MSSDVYCELCFRDSHPETISIFQRVNIFKKMLTIDVIDAEFIVY